MFAPLSFIVGLLWGKNPKKNFDHSSLYSFIFGAGDPSFTVYSRFFIVGIQRTLAISPPIKDRRAKPRKFFQKLLKL